jgi:hypothetical protein
MAQVFMGQPWIRGFLLLDIAGILDLEKIAACQAARFTILPAPAGGAGCSNVN